MVVALLWVRAESEYEDDDEEEAMEERDDDGSDFEDEIRPKRKKGAAGTLKTCWAAPV